MLTQDYCHPLQCNSTENVDVMTWKRLRSPYWGHYDVLPAAKMGHFWGPQNPHYIWVHFQQNVLRIGSYILSSSLQLGFKQRIFRDYGHQRHLIHWGRVTHVCVSKITIIGWDNGLSPGRRQAIIWTSVAIFLIGPLGTNFSEILIEIYTFSFKEMHLKMSSGKWRPFCIGLNVLIGVIDTGCIYRVIRLPPGYHCNGWTRIL